jgi:nucleotide-binding universal stress UspA family protein
VKKILIALDDTARGRRAGEYAAGILPALADCELNLLVLTTGVPGHAEAAEPAPEVHGDEDHQRELIQAEMLLEEIAAMLRESGVASERLQKKIRPVSRGIAQDIVDEATAAGCDTIILGRSESSRVRELFLGSISGEVLHKVENQTVWVVS